ncbi:ectoine/hydroxyectoine ABC transporter ATP-binding protein EhuA [Ornithinimicrobium avium]|uniref:ectoine/hydroxyectoine ABC transporter ATP-binding protein EhuA n=1 Tax=Ornithinimicrobium avium TaxID=2283195 RepID=UPI001D18A7AE|nr:ectoine/hydroxyectoine ABC transporter ATP-binding protein EhuA [Ornithinimicrobium avium]
MPTDQTTPHTPEDGTPRIRFEDVKKKFGRTTVLQDLNFSVGRGERVTLIGPSGSGKTTILRLLMTLERLTGGYIWVDGDPLTHDRRDGRRVELKPRQVVQVRKRIGMVFQQFNLFPNMSVLQNIVEAPVHVLGQSQDEASENALSLLDRVGLRHRADAHPTELSGGQQQRVAIARALAMDPEILLLDEVTSALDPELVGDVLRVLEEVAASTDITMLIVTHEMQFAKDVSQRVMMFDGGKILEEGPPAQIFSDPHHERTQKFLEAVV